MSASQETMSSFLELFATGVIDEPLLYYDLKRHDVVELYGEPYAVSDEHDRSPGPCEYWYLEFDCGLNVVIQVGIGDCYGVNIYANAPDEMHIARHLDFKVNPAWKCSENPEWWPAFKNLYKLDTNYLVERQDDNNNTFTVESNLTQMAATCLAKYFEEKGHKQFYIVKKIKP